MTTRTMGLVCLLIAGTALTPAAALGQEFAYTPPDPVYPLPLNNHLDAGGPYGYGEFLFWRQTNPLEHQLIAKRGFKDVDGSVTLALGGLKAPGAFYGSGRPALFADDAGGPGTYQPGWDFGLGWRFRNGVAVEVTWRHLVTAQYSAAATLIPSDQNVGIFFEESFLFSPVFNFPPDYAGPPNKVNLGNPLALYGIWNGASVDQIFFEQRYDQWDVTGRIPVFETDCWRTYGLVGPRFSWIWERFKWRAVSISANGTSGPEDVAIYSNIVSNRMYGAHVGVGNEWRTGDGPLGTFAVTLDLQTAGLIDIVKERAKYERSDRRTSAHRSRTEYRLVPELEGQLNLYWYPIEGVELRLGYSVMGFFNTIASPRPVDFNFGALAPEWEHETRFFDGLNAGIAFIF